MYIINSDYWESIISQNLFKREDEFEKMKKQHEEFFEQHKQKMDEFNKLNSEAQNNANNNFNNINSEVNNNFNNMQSQTDNEINKINDKADEIFDKSEKVIDMAEKGGKTIIGGFVLLYVFFIGLVLCCCGAIIIYVKRSNKRKKAKYVELTKNNKAEGGNSEAIKNYQNYVNSGISMTDKEKEEAAKSPVVGNTVSVMPTVPQAAAAAPGAVYSNFFSTAPSQPLNTNVPMTQPTSPVSPYSAQQFQTNAPNQYVYQAPTNL